MFGARHEKKAVAVGDSGGGGDVTSRNIGDSLGALGAPRDKQDECCLAAAWKRLIKATRIWQRSRIFQGATISEHVGCLCILDMTGISLFYFPEVKNKEKMFPSDPPEFELTPLLTKHHNQWAAFRVLPHRLTLGDLIS